MHTSILSIVPIEIIDTIIQLLRADLPSLRSLSLVDRYVLHRHRSYTFSKVHIGRVNMSALDLIPFASKFHRFWTKESSKELVSYVREIELSMVGACFFIDQVMEAFSTHKGLEKLSLNIHHRIALPFLGDGQAYGMGFPKHLAGLLESSRESLTHLTICGNVYAVSSPFLRSFRRLKMLKLSGAVRVATAGMDAAELYPHPPLDDFVQGQCGSLEELHFMETSFDVATCVANPSWGPDLTNIRHLSAPATLRYDTLRFMQILSSEALLPNLTHLTIIFDVGDTYTKRNHERTSPPSYEHEFHGLHLRPTLRHLVFRNTNTVNSAAATHTAEVLRKCLSQFPVQVSIESITIVTPFSDLSIGKYTPDGSRAWRELAHLIASFTKVWRVRIAVDDAQWGAEPLAEAEKFLRPELEGLLKEKLLTIERWYAS